MWDFFLTCTACSLNIVTLCFELKWCCKNLIQ